MKNTANIIGIIYKTTANQVLLCEMNAEISPNDVYVLDKQYLNYLDVIRRDIEPDFQRVTLQSEILSSHCGEVKLLLSWK